MADPTELSDEALYERLQAVNAEAQELRGVVEAAPHLRDLEQAAEEAKAAHLASASTCEACGSRLGFDEQAQAAHRDASDALAAVRTAHRRLSVLAVEGSRLVGEITARGLITGATGSTSVAAQTAEGNGGVN